MTPLRPARPYSDPDRSRAQANSRRERYNRAHEHFRAAVIAFGNVICQHVDGRTRVRCDRLAEILHHLLPADDYPELMCDYRNAVMLCRAHHPNSKGDPGGIEYTPTVWPEALAGKPHEEIGPGEVVPKGIELWSLEGQRRVLLMGGGNGKRNEREIR